MSDARESCASQLEELAEDPRYSGRQDDLTSLARSVRDQGDGSWTGVDLVGSFPAEASIHVRDRGGWRLLESVLGILAGVSVFLPVGWTWWGLHDAAVAYRDLLADGDEEGRTFLALWTSGFDGRLLGEHQLVPLAMWAMVLIGFAMACIVTHRLVADINVGREEADARQARADLVGVLGRAQRFLNERRTDDPRFLEEAIKRSVGELNQAHVAAREGVEALAATTDATATQLAATADATAAALGAAAGDAVARLQAAAISVLAELKPLLEATTSAGDKLASSAVAATAAQQQITSTTSSMESVLDQALSKFTSAVVTSTSQLSAGTGETLARLSSQLDTSLASLTGSVGEVAKAKDEWRQSLSAGLGENSEAAKGLAAQTEAFVDLLRMHEGTMQAQVNDLARAADLAQQTLQELRRQPAAAETAQRASTNNVAY